MSFSYSDVQFCASVHIVPDLEPVYEPCTPQITAKDVLLALVAVVGVAGVVLVSWACVVALAVLVHSAV